MGHTYWYAYDRSGEVSGAYFETRDEAADACDDGETPRPVDADVIDIDGGGGAESDASDDVSLDEMDHDELKAEAERRGVADNIDLRSKESIRDALAE